MTYRTVLAPASAEYVDRRSRFLATIYPVESAEAAGEVLRAQRTRYWDAKHHVWAYRLLAGQTERCSDDAEPHGTAGRPALEVLAGRELWNVAVVISRYFGGTLLGTGGLVQAYSGSTRLALEAARLAEYRPGVRFTAVCDYGQYDLFARLLEANGGSVADSDFTDRVRLSGQIEAARFPAFETALREGLRGAVTLEKTGEFAAPFEINC